MRNKIKNNQIIHIIYWSIIIIMTISMVLSDLNIEEDEKIFFQEMTIKDAIEIFISILLLSVVLTAFNMMRVFYLTIIYFGIVIARRKHNRDRIEKIDLKNYNYFRDILPKYSPAVLSYLDDFKIDKKDIVATILMLELKGKIKLEQAGIVILDDNEEDLSHNERYIFIKIKEKRVKDISLLEYGYEVRRDAIKDGLISEKQQFKKNLTRKIITSVIIYLLILGTFMSIPEMYIGESIFSFLFVIVLVILFAFVVFMPFSIVVYISHYKMLNVIDPYIRSAEGKQINKNLEGLRKYLIDYSEIKEKTKEEVILWEEYLVYSVMLGINKKVIEEVYNKI